MSNEELVSAYEQGRLSRRTFIRRLTAGGVTLAAAGAYANLLGPGAKARIAAQAQSLYDTTTTRPATTQTTQPTGTQPTQPTGTQPTQSAPGTSLGAIADPTVTPGQSTEISGSGFAPASELDISFFSTPIRLGTTRSDAAGNYRARITIPLNASAGVHEIVVSGPAPGGGTHRSVISVTVLATTRPATAVGRRPRFTG